jgi:hypothetical protein
VAGPVVGGSVVGGLVVGTVTALASLVMFTLTVWLPVMGPTIGSVESAGALSTE